MIARQQHLERLVIQGQRQDIRFGKGKGDDNGIQLPGAQLAAQHGGEVLLDVERHLGSNALQFRHQMGKQVRADSINGTHPQRAAQLVLAFGGQLPDGCSLLQHPLGLFNDALAQGRDLDATLAALE